MKLQKEDLLIQDLRKKPDQVVEQDGLLYHLFLPRQQSGETVEQQILPKQYHLIACKLAYSIFM